MELRLEVSPGRFLQRHGKRNLKGSKNVIIVVCEGFYPGHPLFQGLSHVLSRLPVILILSYPSRGPHISIFLLACDIALHPSHDSTVG